MRQGANIVIKLKSELPLHHLSKLFSHVIVVVLVRIKLTVFLTFCPHY